MLEEKEIYKVIHVKAILNNNIVKLNSLSENQIEVIPENKRIFYDGEWYFNPDGAVINDNANVEEFKVLAKRSEALAKNEFNKLTVLDAFIAIGKLEQFKGLLYAPENEIMKMRWDAANTIKLSDADVIAALAVLNVDVDAIKLKIAGIN